MRRLSLLISAMLFGSCAMRGQQTIATGINIRPNAAGTQGGFLTIYDAANAVAATLQPDTFGPKLSSTNTNILLLCDPSGGGGGGSWQITRTRIIGHTDSCTGTNNIYMQTDGTIATSLGLAMFESAGLTGDTISIRAPSGGVTSPYIIDLPGTAPACVGDNLNWLTSSTYQWSGGCAWTGYTPSLVAISGGTFTGTPIAAYRRIGKTVDFRTHWTGTLSIASSQVTFGAPGNALAGSQFQPFATLYTVSGTPTLLACGVQASTTNITCASSANIPASTTLVIGLAGTYEEN